jgi:hypothetical protein
MKTDGKGRKQKHNASRRDARFFVTKIPLCPISGIPLLRDAVSPSSSVCEIAQKNFRGGGIFRARLLRGEARAGRGVVTNSPLPLLAF